MPTISVKDFKKVMNENNYELVDVRTTEERKEFNIGGKHIPLNEIETEISFFNNEKSLVLYCASGSRSKEAVTLLKNKFPDKNILSLKGGVKAWKEEM